MLTTKPLCTHEGDKLNGTNSGGESGANKNYDVNEGMRSIAENTGDKNEEENGKDAGS